MLNNARVIRGGTDEFNFVRTRYQLFRPHALGNFAFFQIRCDGPGPREVGLTLRPGRSQTYYSRAEGLYYVFARNAGFGGQHSEEICIDLFRRHFAAPRHQARITLVFSEREPCHDPRPNCMALLDQLLVTENFGDRGADTPVRFRQSWMNRAEIAMAARIALRQPREIRQEDRLDARRGVAELRRGGFGKILNPRRGFGKRYNPY